MTMLDLAIFSILAVVIAMGVWKDGYHAGRISRIEEEIEDLKQSRAQNRQERKAG